MKSFFAITFASMYGFVLHFMYGFLGNFMAIMSLSFLALVPVGIGYLTIALSKPESVRNPVVAFFRPWLTSLALVIVTIILSIEGAICWIIIYPFFAIMAGLGGLLARYVMLNRIKEDSGPDSNLLDDFSDWGKPGNIKSSFLLMLPLLFGALEGGRTLYSKEYTIKKTVIIDAPASRVWAELTRVKDIQPDENRGWMTRTLGMPRHLRTDLDTLAVGGRRTAVYERGLVFDETITRYEHERLMTVDVHADPKKIPPTVLDEHIVVGGQYFSTIEDEYRLETLPDGRCLLQLSGRYTITTPFNWYAGIWAQWLVDDVLGEVLEIVKIRSATTVNLKSN